MRSYLQYRKQTALLLSVRLIWSPVLLRDKLICRMSSIPILLSTYAKILMHTQPPDPVLQNQIWAIFQKWIFCYLSSSLSVWQVELSRFLKLNSFFLRYESCIDVEIQQRAVEYIALSRKGADLADILAEMPKFPERQVCVTY